MNGMFTPLEAFKIAKKLHNDGRFNVLISLRYASNGRLYKGDDERATGKTASISVDLEHGIGIDKINAIRQNIRALGYDTELEGGDLQVMGAWHE